jgi:hypothetical protein
MGAEGPDRTAWQGCRGTVRPLSGDFHQETLACTGFVMHSR